MKHRHYPHRDFFGRHGHHRMEGAGHPHEGHHRGGGHGGRRPFDNGALRLLILHLMNEAPRHGYELMKAIEERMGGSYSPSPGVIYPTLAMLEELGHSTMQADQGGRKRYTITEAGIQFLAANAAAVSAILARIAGADGPRGSARPAQILRAMENLKLALRLKLSAGLVPEAQISRIAELIDQTARAVEQLSTAQEPAP